MFNFKFDIVNSLRAAYAQLTRSDTTRQSKDSGSLNPDYRKERGMDLKLIRQFDDGTATSRPASTVKAVPRVGWHAFLLDELIRVRFNGTAWVLA